jgi:hypothetical protein
LSKFRYPRRKQRGISAKFPPSATDNFSLFKSSAASCGVLNPDLKIMEIVFTEHAKQKLEKRKILDDEVINTIKYSEKTYKQEGKYYSQKDIGRGKIEVVYIKDKYIKKTMGNPLLKLVLNNPLFLGSAKWLIYILKR